MQVKEAPVEYVEVSVDGYYREGDNLVIVCVNGEEEYEDYLCDEALFQDFITEEDVDFDDSLSALLPMRIKISTQHRQTGLNKINTLEVL